MNNQYNYYRKNFQKTCKSHKIYGYDFILFSLLCFSKQYPWVKALSYIDFDLFFYFTPKQLIRSYIRAAKDKRYITIVKKGFHGRECSLTMKGEKRLQECFSNLDGILRYYKIEKQEQKQYGLGKGEQFQSYLLYNMVLAIKDQIELLDLQILQGFINKEQFCQEIPSFKIMYGQLFIIHKGKLLMCY